MFDKSTLQCLTKVVWSIYCRPYLLFRRNSFGGCALHKRISERMKAKHCLESNPVVGFAASPWLFTCNHNQKVNLRRMPLANTRSGSLNTRHGIEGTELSLFAFLISRHLHVLLCCRVASRYLYHYSKTVLLLVHRFFRHTLEM